MRLASQMVSEAHLKERFLGKITVLYLQVGVQREALMVDLKL